jgi:hypothetical protein
MLLDPEVEELGGSRDLSALKEREAQAIPHPSSTAPFDK